MVFTAKDDNSVGEVVPGGSSLSSRRVPPSRSMLFVAAPRA